MENFNSLSLEVQNLILTERLRIHELQIQALSETLRKANPEFYNAFATLFNANNESDKVLKEIRNEIYLRTH